MAEKVTFVGSFPAIQSAIKVSGNGDGMRIIIDIPESEMSKALMLMMYRQVPIRVTVEPYEQENPQTERPGDATGTNRSRTPERIKAKRRDR